MVLKPQDKLAEHFKNTRQSLQLTQKELAEQFQVSPIYISYIENSRRVPSKKLLKQLYRLKNSPVPAEVLHLLNDIKATPETLGQHATVYELKAKGLYKAQTLNKLLKQNPESFVYTMALFRLYQDKGEFEKSQSLLQRAKQHIRTDYNKKWLEAYLHQSAPSEANYDKALQCMEEAVALFDQAYPQLDAQNRKQKSELLFRYATVYYDFAFFLFFHSDLNCPESIARIQALFTEALAKHKVLRQYYLYPYSQLDYANIFYWLATLPFYIPENIQADQVIQDYEHFIEASKAALLFDHAEWLKSFPHEPEYPFYPIEYKIDNGTFLALAHGRLAQLKQGPEAMRFHLQEGELELSRSAALLHRYEASKYRYYYNFGHFYSLKAECLHQYALDLKSTEQEHALGLCEQALNLSQHLSPTQFAKEVQLPSEFYFYKKMRSDAFAHLLKGQS